MGRTLRLRDRAVDLDTGRINDGPDALRAMELKLLRHLVSRAGAVVSHQELLAEVWGYAAAARTRTLYVTWARLRTALEADPRAPVHLQTVAGRGVRLAVEEAAPSPGNLACPAGPLVGRDEALAWLAAARDPLVTLVGPVGVGKTHLALAHGALQDLPGGAWTCALGEVASADDAAARIAATLGLSFDHPARDLAGHLAVRPPTLLLLDDVDEVPGIAPLLSACLRSATAVRLLATARAPLGLPGERCLHLRPLALPGDAARLFVARARAARGDFAVPLDDDELQRLVEAVDGLPLAIEIAAGHAASLTLRATRDALSDPEALPNRRPGIAARHRSLRAAFAWAWSRLPPAARDALCDLAAFEESWRIADARAVIRTAADPSATALGPLGILSDLIDRGWVSRLPGEGEPRFALLRTWRRCIGPPPEAALRRHAAHHAQRAIAFVAATGGLVPDDLDPLVADLEEWLGAARRAAAHDTDGAAPLVDLALRLASFAGRAESADALYRIAAGSASGAVRLRARAWQVEALTALGRHDDARALLCDVVGEAEAAGAHEIAALVQLRGAVFRHNLGLHDEAERLRDAGVAAAARCRGPDGLHLSLRAFADHADHTLASSAEQLARARRAARAFGDAGWPHTAAVAHASLAGTLYFGGRLEEAEAEFHHALSMLPPRAHRSRALATCGLVRILCDRGDPREARALVDGAIDALGETHRELLAFLLVHRARAACGLQELDAAAEAASRALRLAAEDNQGRLYAMARTWLGIVGRRRGDRGALSLLRAALDQSVALGLGDTAREALAEWVDGALDAGVAPRDLLADPAAAWRTDAALGPARGAIAVIRAELHRLDGDREGALAALAGADESATPTVGAAIRLHRAALGAEAPLAADLTAGGRWTDLQRGRWLHVRGHTREATQLVASLQPDTWETLLARAIQDLAASP